MSQSLLSEERVHHETENTYYIFNWRRWMAVKFRYDEFSPMDRSAVYTLSTMAQKSSPKKSIKSPQSSPTKKRLKLDQPKAKRPMNAFMLFAKDHREEYTQKYPGKDNRAISVLLGDEWQKLDLDCRHAYAEKAKQISEQQKKIHPDCWKRKK